MTVTLTGTSVQINLYLQVLPDLKFNIPSVDSLPPCNLLRQLHCVMLVSGWTCMLVFLVSQCQCARILGLFPLPGKGHMIFNSALMKALVRRGHDVTIISPFPENTPTENYTDIGLRASIQELVHKTGMKTPFELHGLLFLQAISRLWHAGQVLCESVLQEVEVQQLIHASPDVHFDLIIVESLASECLLGFAHRFRAPIVQTCSFGDATFWMNDQFGNPSPYSHIPDSLFLETEDGRDEMTLGQRVYNTLIGVYQRFWRRFSYLPRQDAIMRKYFGYDTPWITDLERSTSLILLNSHFTLAYPRSLMPSMVQVGGLHIEEPKPLPMELQWFLDGATDGVIVFSMGSHLKSSDMDEMKIQAFVKTFSQMRQKIIWKWEDYGLPNHPRNVKLGKWLPLSDILAHHNVRVFITHGGLLSCQEAIARGVPILGIPIYGDQKTNVARAVSSGTGILLDYYNISMNSVTWALTELLEKSSYHENADKLAEVYRDQPLSPLETAVFWTEYVLRHKGARHIDSIARNLYWFQYYLLDVFLVMLVGMTTVLVMVLITYSYLTDRKLNRRNRGQEPVRWYQSIWMDVYPGDKLA